MHIVLKNQVCSLESGRVLKNIGIEFEPFWKWKRSNDEWSLCMGSNDSYKTPAYGVAELGEMLPGMIETTRQYELATIKDDDCWVCRYVAGNDMKKFLVGFAAASEAEARARLLIQIIESGYTTVAEINERMK